MRFINSSIVRYSTLNEEQHKSSLHWVKNKKWVSDVLFGIIFFKAYVDIILQLGGNDSPVYSKAVRRCAFYLIQLYVVIMMNNVHSTSVFLALVCVRGLTRDYHTSCDKVENYTKKHHL